MSYDQKTRDQLASCYGATRAACIVMGGDPATIADIASWRRLCASGEAFPGGRRNDTPDPRMPLDERVMWWAAKGCEPNVIAQKVGKPMLQVQAIMAAHA